MSAALKDIEADFEAPLPHSMQAERAVIGSQLNGVTLQVRMVPADFFSAEHQAIQTAIDTLNRASTPIDVVTVSQELERSKQLEDAGGFAKLSALARDADIVLKNADVYARKVVELSQLRRLLGLGPLIARAVDDGISPLDIVRSLQPVLEQFARQNPIAPASSIVLRHIADIIDEQREPEWFEGLLDILERNVLAVLAGPRSTFKSFIALHWVMLAAVNGHPVVILSAEGGGLDRRVAAWLKFHAPNADPRNLPILVLERALNLNSSETMEELRKAIEASGVTPHLLLIDTLSKFSPGVDGNDNAEIAAYLSIISAQIRERYRATVLIVAHSGHGDAKRPRGASTLMCDPDAEYIVERVTPVDMTVTVTRERFKDSPALTPLAYIAEVVDLGRVDKHTRTISSLVMRDSEAPAAVVAAKRTEPGGKAQRQLLNALRANAEESGPGIWTIGEIREIGRKAGLHKATARSAAEALTFSPYMKACTGGWRLVQ